MALCWIISILFMYFFCQGPHTEAAYSTKGQTYVLYADSFSLGLLVWMLRLMNFNELLVFIVIWLMCFAHDKKVSNGAKIRNRYNQVPHLTQDTNGKVTNSQKTPQTRAKRSALSQQVTKKHI